MLSHSCKEWLIFPSHSLARLLKLFQNGLENRQSLATAGVQSPQ